MVGLAMENLWNDAEATRYAGDLGVRTYTSRLLGRNPDLVLHGGGNTSVKIREKDLFGEEEEILYVKGSGWNLETIEPAGFSPTRMAHLLKLAAVDSLTDVELARQLRRALTDPAAADPSVEAILHALLPQKFVDHTHADAILTITNTREGGARIREIYGDTVVLIPYVMPGFKLAKACAELYPRDAGPNTIGMVLLNHGVFSFGATARESYDRMIALVTRAEDYLKARNAWRITFPDLPAPGSPLRVELAQLRKAVSRAAGFPTILSTRSEGPFLHFARRADVGSLAQRGPATPDHVIRTKRLPLVGRDVASFCSAYEAYFAEHAPHSPHALTMLDPAPRVVLDHELGLCAIGRTAADAAVVADIYRHTIDIVLRATALGGYEALPPRDIFECEYWDLEQAKLKRAAAPRMFAGEIALVTGAASGIGRACAESLLARGAAVVALDLKPEIVGLYARRDAIGLQCDIAHPDQVAGSLEHAARAFGGLDMLVLNAGLFPASRRIEASSDAEWEGVLRVNLHSNLTLLRESYPLLKLAPGGGRVVVIGSKNVAAPGPGAAAYSASKAALIQLGRVAALEWGADGIRINMVHPDAVFDTGIWTDEVLRSRAAQYGMTVDEYRTKNVLRTEIRSRDVGEVVAELCGPLFAKTTGAQIPIDGGNDRVI
jgi:rhamnose utilization protein RhaD (predicted bifunctional aldolase and dehydrogenase)/NAD(P)-dependent dehydrogenase (short-subunit alcohol dehydrogenase family)